MINRYLRQILFAEIGEEGQKKLSSSSVAIIGCGGLGSVISILLVRAGVGKVKVIDKDLLEYHNLHRQVLYNEDDVRDKLPKAVAAERHLRKVNSSVEITGVIANVDYTNIENLVDGVDLILDGSDNIETRFVINDISLKHKVPWVYGGVSASYGMTMNIIPGMTPCLRCVYHRPPDKNLRTADRAVGIIGPAPFVIGTFEAVEAMKILIGIEGINRDLIVIDVWKGTFYRIKINPRTECPSCHGKYEFLNAKIANGKCLVGKNSLKA